MTDQELRDLVASLAVSSKRVDEKLDRLADAQVKTDAQLAQTDKQLAKTDAQLAKTDKQLAKTDAKLDRVSELLGNISNNMGAVAENFFYNSMKESPTLAGVEYDKALQRLHGHSKGVQDEFDILLINGRDIAVIEVKYHAHEQDVLKVANSKVENFRKLFPEYSDYAVHPVLASFYADHSVLEAAQENGVILLERKGDLIETYVPK